MGRKKKKSPKSGMAGSSKGSVFFREAVRRYQAGQFGEAAVLCRRSLDYRPGYADAMHVLGMSLFESGSSVEGEVWVRNALELQPDNPDFHFSLGNILQTQGRPGEALTCFETVTVLNPDHSDAHYNLGNLHLGQENAPMAAACFNRALQLNPDAVGAWHNLGVAQAALGRVSDARGCYERAIALCPSNALSLNSMGILMLAQGDLEAAKACLINAVELNPEYAAAWMNLGNVYSAMAAPEGAEICFLKALSIQASQPPIYLSLANLYQETGDVEKALEAYKTALTLQPDYPEAVSQSYYLARLVCDWPLAKQMANRLDADTHRSLNSGVRPAEMPFINLIRKMDPGLNLLVAGAWSREAVRWASDAGFSFSDRIEMVSQKKRITIGYLSGDFRNHPVGLLISGILHCHDRNRFRVHGYAYGPPDNSGARDKTAAGCDWFVDLGRVSAAESARMIYEDGVDILIDLTGHTRGNRIGICALRPAPVQVSYLGFLGSSGAGFMDYILTDRLTTRHNQARFYSEKFVYLPDSFMVTDNRQPISQQPVSRGDFGLPEDAFVFCSFNNTYKIEPCVFDCWMNILKQVPGSVLWLFAKNSLTVDNLKREAAFRNVLPERLVFAAKMPLPEHLARLKLADLALDTWRYNGGATTVNALWAGVPVITLAGGHFVSRMAASSLSAIGLVDLITHEPESYERLAVRLATCPEVLGDLRETLAKKRVTAPLFDTRRFTKHLEAAYEAMWTRVVAGEPPGHIIV